MDFVKLLYDKLLALHLKHADGPDEWRFPRPSFKVGRPAGGRAGALRPGFLCCSRVVKGGVGGAFGQARKGE